MVDDLLEKRWSRRTGEFIPIEEVNEAQEPVQATCSCGSGIPVQNVYIDDQEVTLIALPLIFEQIRQAGKPPLESTAKELLDTVKIYNPIPEGKDGAYAAAILEEYGVYCHEQERVT